MTQAEARSTPAEALDEQEAAVPTECMFIDGYCDVHKHGAVTDPFGNPITSRVDYWNEKADDDAVGLLPLGREPRNERRRKAT
jgi:hypothetical protein